MGIGGSNLSNFPSASEENEMWNGQDPFLKERLFGLTGPQGNRGDILFAQIDRESDTFNV
jgi:hypothetical protein